MNPPVSFPENWTAPRELTRALPRETSMTGSALFMAVIAGLMILGCVPLFLFIRTQDNRVKARNEVLRTQGREATGEVQRLWRTSGKESRNMVKYAFTANGVRLNGQSSVPSARWDKVRRAGFLPIRYLPSDPAVNHPAAWEQSTEPAWAPFTAPAMLAAGGSFLVFILRRQAQLMAQGLPAVGVVTRSSRVKGGWALRYQFRMKDGGVASGSSHVRRRGEVGATVCVLYLPQNPRRNQVYPTGLYRVTQ
jgi:hypothetical protein